MSSKRVCPNCGRKMKQQFIGLFHCKCGLSWKRDIGFFERTPNMVFALERIQAGKKVKQVPVIRYKQPIEGDTWQNQRLENCQAKIFRLKLNDILNDPTSSEQMTDICSEEVGSFHSRTPQTARGLTFLCETFVSPIKYKQRKIKV